MSLEQARQIVAAKDVSTAFKRELFLQALQVITTAAFQRGN